MALTFEWHELKASENRRKHRVTFDEAKTVFADPWSLAMPDDAHSSVEERWVRVGLSANARVLVVVYAERDDNIRLISARRANMAERTAYLDDQPPDSR